MLNLASKIRILFTPFDLIILAVIFCLGLSNLNNPFTDDQSLFITGAKAISDGKVLYRDFWDWKQPGIYWFYFLAGRLFGFHEFGIHLFELIYQMLLAIVLQITLRSYYLSRFISSLVPLFVVGIYYLVCNPSNQAEVETLVGFPIFLCLWFAYQASQLRQNRTLFLFISGIMGGIVLLFKLMFLPIILSIWLIILIEVNRQKYSPFKYILVEFLTAIGFGVLLPLGITLIYFSRFGILEIIYKTFIVYPPQINSQFLKNNTHVKALDFFIGIKWFLKTFSILIGLSLFSIFNNYNNLYKITKKIERNLFFGWIIFGIFVILSQFTSLWHYHYFLIIVPLGILANKGLDILWFKIKIINKKISAYTITHKNILIRIVTLLFALIAVALLIFISQKVIVKVNRTMNLLYLDSTSNQRQLYGYLVDEVAFLYDSKSLSGNIYVIGSDPFYYLSNRGQAISINGLYPVTLLPELWTRMSDELKQVCPPYIYIQNRYKKTVEFNAPHINEWILQNYVVFKEGKEGTWHVLKTTFSP